jgi:DNA-binding winged helix-turn-helix (wHTH) protein/tetratricopeptide (TPR) repeat protein
MRVFRLGERLVDLAAGTVSHRGEVSPLTAIEAKLLRHLARRAGEVVPREELLVEVWGYRPGVQSRTIDTTTARLRGKLEDDPHEPVHLVALYGQGLRLDGAEPQVPPGTLQFVGRKAELVRTCAMLRGGARLVTLTGPAGVGKSRMASEIVLRLGLEPTLVACGAVRSTADLDLAVHTALGLGPLGSAWARAPQGVLLLDECELCTEAVARRAEQWLTEAPALQILVTSRARLGIVQEQVVALGPLEPEDAVALFLACLHRADASMPADEPGVRKVVERLEGLPLALELAATRCPVVGLERLIVLLGAPLGVLGGPGRRSMGEVLERSFEALSPELRRGLAQLSVFETSLAPDDVAAVLDKPEAAAVRLLEELASRSLLRMESGLYALYAVVRERARQELPPDDPCRERLVRWLARLGDPELLVSRGSTPALQATLRRALPDLRAVLAQTLSERCGLAAVWSLESSGGLEEGVALGERVLAIAQTPRIRVRLAILLARLWCARNEPAIGLSRLEGEVGKAEVPYDLVVVRCQMAICRREQGDQDGVLRELELARPHVPLAGAAGAQWLQVMGFFAADPAESERALRESVQLARKYCDRNREIGSLLLLARRLAEQGAREVEPLYARALELCESDEVTAGTRAQVLASLGGLMRFVGAPEAEATLEEARVLARKAGHSDLVDGLRLELAHLWLQQGRLQDVKLEVEPLTWEVARPSYTTAHALLVWGELWLRQDAPERAEVALREALAHAREGLWPILQAEAHELLAVTTSEPSHLREAAALNGALGAAVRREALASLLLAQRGELEEAWETWERARDGALRFGLGPGSGVAFWLERALREVQARGGGTGTASPRPLRATPSS